jgi:hypothetical protein
VDVDDVRLVSNLHVGLRGMMNTMFPKALPAKTHRVLVGDAGVPKPGEGIYYGYRVLRGRRRQSR